MKYQEIKEIGRGSFGVVHKVKDEEGYFFARKTFAPNIHIPKDQRSGFEKRFKREVYIQKELGGASVTPILDYRLNGDNLWFTMPLATKTYKKQIQEDQFESKVSIEAIADILNGIHRLHEAGYVHRDLNPNNILLHDGNWKLSDLGAALPSIQGTITLTKDTLIYTESYCAPEQRKKFHNATAAADIYSFGCILHDIFGKTHNRIPYEQHTAEGDIGVIIEKCTNSNPLKRPNIETLKPMVLEVLLTQSGQCILNDTESVDWLSRMENISDWIEDDYTEFGRFFATLDIEIREQGHEKSWVYSESTPFLTRINKEFFRHLIEKCEFIATNVIEKYCEWASSTNFAFNYADVVSDNLAMIFDQGEPAQQAYAFASLVKLGNSHNRWYVMRKALSKCSATKNTPLSRRLAIELKTEELEWDFKRIVLEMKFKKENLPPALNELLN